MLCFEYNRTAQHSTAQHSTAQHSTALTSFLSFSGRGQKFLPKVQSFIAFVLAFALIVCTGIPAFASTTSVEYLYHSADSSGNVISETRTANCNRLFATDTTWNSGWYYVRGVVTNPSSVVTVSGDVNLILTKTSTFTVAKGIYVKSGSSLTIYNQPDGGGKLITTGEDGQAGIGGRSIAITIHGGKITATGGANAAGIGGNISAINTTITIYGGEITATGGVNGAGIGGGNRFDKCAVNIYGGNITARSYYSYCTCENCTEKCFSAGISPELTSCNGCDQFCLCAEQFTLSPYAIQAIQEGYGIRGQITLSYRNAGDSIYATSYGGSVKVADGKTFIVDGTEISGTVEVVKVEKQLSQNAEVAVVDRCPALDGKTLTPPSYNVNVGTIGITVSPARAFPGETVTVSHAEGYNNLTSVKVNGTAITGNTFTMPANDVTVTAATSPITYTLTYELDGGSIATPNPTEYTIESESFTLNNPTKNGSTFAGWIGTGLDEAAMTVEITKGSTGDREYTATWTGGGSEPETNAPSFKTYQLKLEGRIEVIFYADIPEKFRNSDTTVIFDVSGDKSNNNPRVFDEDFKNASGSYYGFKCEITSVQMADVITATLNYKDGDETKTTTLKCRAKDYLDYGIEHETDSTTRELLKAIKDYGHYVQPSLAQENGWTVGKEHAEMDCATDETTFDSYISGAQSDVSANYAAEVGSNTAGITSTYQLDLKSDTEVYVYVSPASSVSATYLDGSEYSVIRDGRYCVNISGVSAHLLGSPYTVTVKYGDSKEFDIKVSVLSYVNTVLSNSSDSVIRRAVTSLYRYYTATKAYRQAHGYND